MRNTTAHTILTQFRRDIYQTLGLRKDSLFELLEAALAAPGPATLVRLTLTPPFRRRWPSAADALTDGRLDVERCRQLIQTTLVHQAVAERPVWALDGTVWPRPAAATSAERTYGHRPLPGIPQDGVVPGWEYEWLVQVPEPGSSWVLPLDVRRRGPQAGTPPQMAITLLAPTSRLSSRHAPPTGLRCAAPPRGRRPRA